MRYRLSFFLASLCASVAATAQTGAGPAAGIVRVRLATSDGAIVVALDTRHAPKTTANFLAYVDDGRLDGTTFFRAARSKSQPRLGLVEGGIGGDARRSREPVALEPTTRTGLRHLAGTISMARDARPDSATGNFSILAGPSPNLDAHGGNPGYAAFGHVIAGMDTVRRILAEPTAGGAGAMKGEMIVRPVRLISARRLDGAAAPAPAFKPWLIGVRR